MWVLLLFHRYSAVRHLQWKVLTLGLDLGQHVCLAETLLMLESPGVFYVAQFWLGCLVRARLKCHFCQKQIAALDLSGLKGDDIQVAVERLPACD